MNRKKALYPDRTEELEAFVSFRENAKRDVWDDTLNEQINYTDSLAWITGIQKAYSDSLAAAYERQVLTSDSLRHSDSLNFLLYEKIASDSIRIKNAEIDKEKSAALWNYFLIALGVALVGGFAFLLYYRKRNNERLVRRGLELESLKGAFFGHAIKRSFKSIVNRIRLGIEDHDQELMESAIKITESLNLLFAKMAENTTGESNLAAEIDIARRYISSISLTGVGSISWKLTVDHHVAKEIIIPSHILIHFYVNSVWHGNLLRRIGASIETTLDFNSADQSYTLSIKDNGTGMALRANGTGTEKRMGGCELASRRFASFNQERRPYKFEFEPARDMLNLLDETGQTEGLKVKIKIRKTWLT